MAHPHKGHKISAATRAKISKAEKGKHHHQKHAAHVKHHTVKHVSRTHHRHK